MMVVFLPYSPAYLDITHIRIAHSNTYYNVMVVPCYMRGVPEYPIQIQNEASPLINDRNKD